MTAPEVQRPEPSEPDVKPEPSATPIFDELAAQYFPASGTHAKEDAAPPNPATAGTAP